MRALKKLGQHFLVSPEVALFMVRAAKVGRKDVVLEIGPGKGIITRLLAKKAKEVYAIEKDRRMREFLSGMPENVHVIWGDALKVEWPPANKIVANLPFNIASQVLFRIPESVEVAVLGLQREFAEKMVAKPGEKNYGRLSVSSQLLFEVEVLKNFPPQVFKPVPKVWLSIVRLKPKERPGKWEEMEEFIRKIFSYPNKMVGNALELAGYQKLKIGKKVRELSPGEVAELFEKVQR